MIEDLEIVINSIYIKQPDKKKNTKYEEELTKIGSVSIDFCVDIEDLEKLTTVLQEEVFAHDPVELTVTYKSRSY